MENTNLAGTTISVCDDDPVVVTTLRLVLEKQGFKVLSSTNPGELLHQLQHQDIALILMDMNFHSDTTSGKDGIALLESIRERDTDIPVVIMTGWASVELAVSSMQKGANDFIQKPWENTRLLSIINTQLKLAQSHHQTLSLQQENKILRAELSGYDSEGMIIHSKTMQQFLKKLEQVARTDSNLLLTGENGTGKSMFAHWVHEHSNRNKQRFVEVNMGAITEALFESEMFGHKKGAFTDAKTEHIGRFELANQGTLFLDEIANLPLSQQAKLLRVLESQQFEKVGSTLTQHSDVRVISATNAVVETLIQQELFRSDLFYRLNTVQLEVPPLRDRHEDIVPLAHYFVSKFAAKYKKVIAQIDNKAQLSLQEYHWPGNIRELSHVIERAVIFAESKTLQNNDLTLPDTPLAVSESEQLIQNKDKAMPTMAEIEQQALQQRLTVFSGNANEAAQSLGLSRSAFYRRLDKYKD